MWCKVRDTSHLQFFHTESCVSDFTSLCVQVFVSACRHEKSSPETLSEMTLSLVVALRSRDVPLRRWLVSLLFPGLALKGLYGGVLFVFQWASCIGLATFRLNNVSKRFRPCVPHKVYFLHLPHICSVSLFYFSMASTLFFPNLTCHFIIRHIFEMKCAAFTKANGSLKHCVCKASNLLIAFTCLPTVDVASLNMPACCSDSLLQVT